jgi:peptidoglycan hydrolase CwlO-like protein
MDPDTTRKVTDLLDLMEDISSDAETKSGLHTLSERIETLENKVEELTAKFDQLERMYQEKRSQIKSLQQDLHALFPDA